MLITAQFDLGQRVWHIHSAKLEVRQICPVCNGEGRIRIHDIEMRCPYSPCFDGQVRTYLPQAWRPDVSGTVGQVEAKCVDQVQTNLYMLHETGIGGGRVYHEEDLFASMDEAQAECDIRNRTALQEAPIG